MQTFLLVFVLFVVVVLAMAVGYIILKSPFWSCGGIGALGMEKAATVTNHKRKDRMRKEAQWKENEIR